MRKLFFSTLSSSQRLLMPPPIKIKDTYDDQRVTESLRSYPTLYWTSMGKGTLAFVRKI